MHTGALFYFYALTDTHCCLSYTIIICMGGKYVNLFLNLLYWVTFHGVGKSNQVFEKFFINIFLAFGNQLFYAIDR